MNYFRLRKGFIDLSHVISFSFNNDLKELTFITDIPDLSISVTYIDNDEKFYLVDKERLINFYLRKCEDYIC